MSLLIFALIHDCIPESFIAGIIIAHRRAREVSLAFSECTTPIEFRTTLTKHGAVDHRGKKFQDTKKCQPQAEGIERFAKLTKILHKIDSLAFDAGRNAFQP